MEANYFTRLYLFCHTLTWIHHGCTCVPHPDPPSHLPPHPIPLGHSSAPAPSTLSHASNLDWQSVSHMVIYMFQCHSPKRSHPRPLPQSPKDCSIHLYLFCCLIYRVIVTILLNSIYNSQYTVLVFFFFYFICLFWVFGAAHGLSLVAVNRFLTVEVFSCCRARLGSFGLGNFFKMKCVF